MDPMMAAWSLLLLFTAKWPGGNPVQRSFEGGPDNVGAPGARRGCFDGRDRPRWQWLSRRSDGRVRIVGSDRRGLVVEFVYGMGRRVWWTLWGGGSRTRAGDGQQGRMFLWAGRPGAIDGAETLGLG